VAIEPALSGSGSAIVTPAHACRRLPDVRHDEASHMPRLQLRFTAR